MGNLYDKTNTTIRRAHQELAHDITVRQYSWDSTAGSNDYADGDWTSTESTVQGTVRKPQMRDTVTGPDGEDLDVEAEIYIPANDVAVTLGANNEERATEFDDSRTGLTYKAVDYHDEGSLVRIYCVII